MLIHLVKGEPTGMLKCKVTSLSYAAEMQRTTFNGFMGEPSKILRRSEAGMVQATTGWNCDIERGPDCLFVRPRGSVSRADEAGLADQVWDLLERSSNHRLVLELDDVGLLKSILVGQLLLLKQRIENRGGLMRLCGLSPANQRVLANCRLDHFLPQYCDRTEAVMSSARPLRPR